jgi:hypothetical protein
VSRTEGCQVAFTSTAYLYYVQNTAKMKLNVKNIRYLTPDDWRVLTAVRASIAAKHPGLTLT